MEAIAVFIYHINVKDMMPIMSSIFKINTITMLHSFYDIQEIVDLLLCD